jgi:dipeptidyl aminopeptidase/acylaminoacyl peptidase
MGQSFGGYSTYGLITLTHRFQAAVAMAGFSDLVSLAGEFSATARYPEFAHEDPFRMWESETAYMGNPPWRDLHRYLVNSPLHYAERVQTPLLIVHGDLDSTIPIRQSEEFFSALYRQNKRAMFVRYWGEGHVLESPANIQDLWERILAWFDEFLSP